VFKRKACVGIVFRNLLKSPFAIWQFYNFYVFCDVLIFLILIFIVCFQIFIVIFLFFCFVFYFLIIRFFTMLNY
jgi:hypothetical protein